MSIGALRALLFLLLWAVASGFAIDALVNSMR